jgi:hypothetical protein
MKVSLRVHEPDTDEWNAEIAGFLAVIAGEHPESARVNGQRLVQRELRREIRNRTGRLRITMLPPGVACASGAIERLDGGIVDRQVALIRGRVSQRLLREHLQHQHRVVCGLTPQRVIEFAEDFARLRIPRPPQISRQFGESMQPFGDRRSTQTVCALSVRACGGTAN